MSNYLLTWYGITDLRASLGFEKQGPVLSALMSGGFSHATILAYVNMNKELLSADIPILKTRKISKKNFVEKFIEFFSKNRGERENSRSCFKNLTDGEAYSYVEKISNTPQAHKHFKAWLEEQLSAAGKNVKIDIKEVALKKLNDTDAIYGATLDAFNFIRGKKAPEDIVSVFLSPGTPIMAFSWALGAIRNPDMNIRVISSSSLKKNIEEIALPAGLSNLEVRELNTSKPDSFDVIFHLLGAQPLPTVLALNQFKSKNHVFVTAPPYNADNVKKFIPMGANSYTLEVNPYLPSDVEKKISGFLGKYDWKIKGFNLTGGTKMMYEGALQACKKAFAVPFYFEAKKASLIWLNSYEAQDTIGIGKIDDFFEARGYKILNSGQWTKEMEERIKYTNFLWKNSSLISRCYKGIIDATNKAEKDYKNAGGNTKSGDGGYSYKVEGGGFSISFDGHDGKVKFSGNSGGAYNFTLKDCPDFTKYITGGWLEEFVYWQLMPLMGSGSIFDMRIGMEIYANAPLPLQEFDVIFTDRKRLFIIECKAGSWSSDAVIKLQNNISTYVGDVGRGCLATCFPSTSKTKLSVDARLGRDTRVILLSGRNIPSSIKDIIRLSDEKAEGNAGKKSKPQKIQNKKRKRSYMSPEARVLSRLMDE